MQAKDPHTLNNTKESECVKTRVELPEIKYPKVKNEVILINCHIKKYVEMEVRCHNINNKFKLIITL